jgi:nucleotide-binding universal stress UspA family protein
VTATRPRIDRIVCPVDFSPFSARALEHALRVARVLGARLLVLHVVPPLPSLREGSGFPFVDAPEEIARAQRATAEDELQRLCAPFSGHGVPLETRVEEGDPARSIRAFAQNWPADLLVMGTHGRGGFERFVLGSVAEKVIRSAPCAVLAVPRDSREPDAAPGFHRIVCGLDLTDTSAHTLRTALALAAENTARLTILHVLEGLPAGAIPRFPVALPDLGPLRRDLVAGAHEALRLMVPQDAGRLCSLDLRVESGTPWRELVRLAEETKADLVVVGAHARRGGGNSYLGAT